MSAIKALNPKAEVARAAQALAVNISAAKGLQDVLKSNLGPKGTMKMLVSGAGEIKITKDGNVLLHEMQIQHPTASLIARVATAQDDVTGDGTTSTVLLIGEILKQADIHIDEGVHPRVLTEGLEKGKQRALEILESMRTRQGNVDREVLLSVARTSLRTKVSTELADHLTEIVTDAVLAIQQPGQPIDLHMVEMMEMMHKTENDSRLVRGLVFDHGARHPDMPKRVENAYVLACNVSMEYEKSEVNSSFFYKTAEDREKLVRAEREFTDDKVRKVIALKREVCAKDPKASFVVINLKGIDPFSLDMLASEGIMALRRAKRRNMERLALACGATPVNSVDDVTADALGRAGLVYEHVLGEEKFTFVEQCSSARSVTILLKGSSKYALLQMKDAVHDGLRAVKNALDDQCVIPGGGAFEVAASRVLHELALSIPSKARLGVQTLADALLIIPKTLAANAGLDAQEAVARLLQEAQHRPLGLDLTSGEPMLAEQAGVLDNYCVKRQTINSAAVIASNLLLVDEIMRAGLSSLKG